jgi:uncharacterized phiE125 gp8 family phage protein
VESTFGLTLVTAPAEEPITLAEAKLHLRVSHAEEDALITRLIKSARRRCEAETRRALVTQTWDLVLPEWPCEDRRIVVPLAPLQTITSVSYVDPAGATVVLPSGDYKVRPGSPGLVMLRASKSWPSLTSDPDPITVRFVAGYGAAAAVPESLLHGMLLLIGSGYEHREDRVTGTIAPQLDGYVADLWAAEAWGYYG